MGGGVQGEVQDSVVPVCMCVPQSLKLTRVVLTSSPQVCSGTFSSSRSNLATSVDWGAEGREGGEDDRGGASTAGKRGGCP